MDGNQIIEAVMKTTEEVFENMISMKVKGESYKKEILIPEEHLTAMVGFVGSYMGLAAIHCSKRFARRIIGAMLKIDSNAFTDEDIRDVLGEIANMIAGHFKAQLVESLQTHENVFEQSVPSVICGDGYETCTATEAPKYCVMFQTDIEPFYVELALKKNGETEREGSVF